MEPGRVATTTSTSTDHGYQPIQPMRGGDIVEEGGTIRDGGRWYCRVEFERTLLRMEIRR